MIQIRNIKERSCDLYKGKKLDHSYIGHINTIIDLLDIRLQIKKQAASDYYIYWKDMANYEHYITIDSNGKLSHRPIGFFDKCDDLLTALI